MCNYARCTQNYNKGLKEKNSEFYKSDLLVRGWVK